MIFWYKNKIRYNKCREKGYICKKCVNVESKCHQYRDSYEILNQLYLRDFNTDRINKKKLITDRKTATEICYEHSRDNPQKGYLYWPIIVVWVKWLTDLV